MESIKEIVCHLVLLIICWHDDLQIPVHVVFEKMCKYLSLPLSLKAVNMFGRKSITKISYVQRKKKMKVKIYYKITCSCYLLTITALTGFLLIILGVQYLLNTILQMRSHELQFILLQVQQVLF